MTKGQHCRAPLLRGPQSSDPQRQNSGWGGGGGEGVLNGDRGSVWGKEGLEMVVG